MDILMIGNGFDIEHGLPTTYEDFLQFVESFKLTYLDIGYAEECGATRPLPSS